MRWLLALLLIAPALAGCIGPTDETTDEIEAQSVGDAGGFSDTAVFPGDYDTSGDFSVVLEAGPLDMLPGEVTYLGSSVDGTAVQIGVVRPDVPEGQTVPVITLASPYHVPLQTVDLRDYHQRLVDNFVPHGYAVAFVAVRGTADSGGCSDLFGPMEQTDLDQAITWLGTQDWSNGNVGMIGVSYDGSTPWIVAATGNPHLKTIVPISGLSDVFQLEYRNGTVEQRMLGLVSTLYWAYGFGLNNPANGRDPVHTAEGFVCPAFVEGLAASMNSGVTGERDALGFFEERNHRPGVEANYQGSIFLVHGLQDWNVDPHHAYPWVNELEDQGITVKHLLGQWGHAWPDSYLGFDDDLARGDWAEVLLHWFDHELKEDATVDIGPRVQVQDNQLNWRSEDAWPPEDATPTKLWIGPGGLTWEEPDTTASFPVVPDPSLALGEPVAPLGECACLQFESDPLDKELRFAGQPRVHVTVTPSAPGGTVAAYLYAMKGGETSFLGWTMMDLRFHEGGETATTVTPGEPIVAKMWLEPLDVVVDEGSTLVLAITSGSQHDRLNVGMGAPMLVEAGAQSVITLDTFERSEDVFFEAP